MKITGLSKTLILIAIALHLSACGGGNDDADNNTQPNIWDDGSNTSNTLIWDDGSNKNNMKWAD